MVALGVFLHGVGGFAAGSFYIPLKKLKEWAWESGWLINGVFSWIIAPWVVALITVPGLMDILSGAPLKNLFWTWFFGALWGIRIVNALSGHVAGLCIGARVLCGIRHDYSSDLQR